MKLPIPLIHGGEGLVAEIDVKPPRPVDIAAIQRAAEKGDIFSGFSEFIEGVTELKGSKVNSLAFKSAEAIVYESVMMAAESDEIEGYYECPRCSTPIICDGENSDRYSDIKTEYLEEDTNQFTITLKDPVTLKIKSTREGDSETIIERITFRYPSLSDCKKAGKTGTTGLEQNLHIYERAILEINDAGVSEAWKASWGWPVVKLLSLRDAKETIKEGNRYGMVASVPRVCAKCKKKWDSPLNIADFFSSALGLG